MDFDDKQDANEKRFEERKADYLNGEKFNVKSGLQDLDSLLMQMYLSDVTSYESVARLDQAINMMQRQTAHVRHLAVMDYGDAEEEALKLSLSTFGGWYVKSFRSDSDFVDEAVTHIMEGTAAAFFE